MKTFCNILIITLLFTSMVAEKMIQVLLNISLMFQTSASYFSFKKELARHSRAAAAHYGEGKQADRQSMYNLKLLK